MVIKKEIHVFLRLSQKSHPLYEELWKYPPEDIEYVIPSVIHYSSKENWVRKIRNFIWGNYLKLFIPAVPLSYKNCDLIHSTNNLSLISNNPWIVDTESGHGLFGFNYFKANNFFYKFLLKNILKSEKCRKILFWSKIAQKSFIYFNGEKLNEKSEVIYPAHHIPRNFKKKKENKEITLLFVSRRFEEKGGYETLEAFNRIKKEFPNCKLVMISDFPKRVLEKCRNLDDIELIKSDLSREKLSIYYQKADIFVYPTRIDSFGFVILEAMAYKLPVISTNIYAIPEMIENGKNGFLIEPLIKWYDENGKPFWGNDFRYLKKYKKEYNKNKEKIINQLIQKLKILIENKRMREKMGKEGFKLIKDGKFSIKERNKKLGRIYRKALK